MEDSKSIENELFTGDFMPGNKLSDYIREARVNDANGS